MWRNQRTFGLDVSVDNKQPDIKPTNPNDEVDGADNDDPIDEE